MNRRMFWFDETDDAALEAIRQHFNVKTKAQAIRLSLRIAMQANNLALQKRRSTKTPAKGNFFDRVLARSKRVQIAGLPDDFSERLDDYLYGDLVAR